MRIKDKRIRLKNGKLCILRSPKVEDTEQLHCMRRWRFMQLAKDLIQ